MLKGGHTFEKYSVALPYQEVGVMLNWSCGQWNQSPMLAFGSGNRGCWDRWPFGPYIRSPLAILECCKRRVPCLQQVREILIHHTVASSIMVILTWRNYHTNGSMSNFIGSYLSTLSPNHYRLLFFCFFFKIFIFSSAWLCRGTGIRRLSVRRPSIVHKLRFLRNRCMDSCQILWIASSPHISRPIFFFQIFVIFRFLQIFLEYGRKQFKTLPLLHFSFDLSQTLWYMGIYGIVMRE